jgi:hypothetical protein
MAGGPIDLAASHEIVVRELAEHVTALTVATCGSRRAVEFGCQGG